MILVMSLNVPNQPKAVVAESMAMELIAVTSPCASSPAMSAHASPITKLQPITRRG